MVARLLVNGGKSIRTLNDREGLADLRRSSSIRVNSYAFGSLIHRASELSSRISFRCQYAIAVHEDHVNGAQQVIDESVQ